MLAFINKHGKLAASPFISKAPGAPVDLKG